MKKSNPEKNLHVRASTFVVRSSTGMLPDVTLKTCVVSFTGERGVRDSVEVTADSRYEASAQAVAMFKQSEWADVIGPATELAVAVKHPETSHTVALSQIRRWCDGVAVSPDEILKRRRVKTMIGSHATKPHTETNRVRRSGEGTSQLRLFKASLT